MRTKKSLIIITLIIAHFIFAAPARCEEATAAMRGSIDAVLDILKDPNQQGPEKRKERRDGIMKVVRQRFDFVEMSRLVLGKYWRERTDAEKKEFTDLFPRLLESVYVGKLEKYNGETIAYGTELRFDDRALVRTKIITKQGTRVPVDYRVMKEEKGWMVYDIVIEGVSLVNNYRSQFNDILSQKPYSELEKMLREKVKGL